LRVCSIFGFIIFLFTSQIAKGQDFLVERDLRLDWIFKSGNQQQMLPFLDHSSEMPYAIHLPTQLNYGKETYLKMDIPSGTSLFIDNKFLRYFEGDTTKLFSMDSLFSLYQQDSIYLTLFNKAGFGKPPRATIGYLHASFDTGMNVNPIAFREIDTKADFLKIIILTIFTFFVVLHSLLPAELLDFYSISTLFAFRYTDTFMTKFRSLTKTHTLVIIYQAAMLASIMIVSLHYYNNPLGDLFIMKINPIFGWLIVFLITLALIFLKYVLISIVSHLFGVADRINFYFLEYLRMAMIFYSLIFVVVSYMIINHLHSLDSLLNTLIFVVIGFNFLRLIMIYFKFRRNIPIKNLHLFSYLCSTELIPIVVGLNFFVK
jgi:hypothetical protein